MPGNVGKDEASSPSRTEGGPGEARACTRAASGACSHGLLKESHVALPSLDLDDDKEGGAEGVDFPGALLSLSVTTMP